MPTSLFAGEEDLPRLCDLPRLGDRFWLSDLTRLGNVPWLGDFLRLCDLPSLGDLSRLCDLPRCSDLSWLGDFLRLCDLPWLGDVSGATGSGFVFLAYLRRLSRFSFWLELFVFTWAVEEAFCWAALMSKVLVVSIRSLDFFCLDAGLSPGLGILVILFGEVGGFVLGGPIGRLLVGAASVIPTVRQKGSC